MKNYIIEQHGKEIYDVIYKDRGAVLVMYDPHPNITDSVILWDVL